MNAKRLATITLMAAVAATFCQAADAGDWPMWRADARRSGVVSESLPEELHLQWVRSLPERRVAWPNESRLQFDASYEPVVVGKRLFVASSTDGSVVAIDTDSGKQLWQFYSEGPVRLAPVVSNDRVFFGSDDGFLYCVHAETGQLEWKVRGAPEDRPDYRHLGNTRLVSYWPVRGGPVVNDGVVYFGAGIWPTLGVFVHAVDAETGEIKWTNSNTNFIKNVRIDHNYLDDVGLSPQGHFLFVDGKLVIPNGRSMPARFDPDSGQLQYYVQGYRNGDSRVSAGGPFLFVGERGVVSLKDGREVGNRWVAAGDEAPAAWSTAKRDLFEGPFDQYKFLPGCDYRSVFDGNMAVGVENGVLHGYDIGQAKTTLYEKKMGESVIRPARWDLATRWDPIRIAKQPSGPTRATIKAGNRVYTHVGKTLVAVDVPQSNDVTEPSVAWTKELEATPTTMLAADDKLFVVLEDGQLCCFGEGSVEPAKHILPEESLSDLAQRPAADLLKASNKTAGYALVLGLESGHLIDALLQQSDLHVIAIDADPTKVNALRSRFTNAHDYGTRVEAFIGDPATFEFPPYIANLIVSEKGDALNPLNSIQPERLFSLLRPYGGAALVPNTLVETHTAWTDAKIAGASVRQQHKHFVMHRAGAAEGAADWTHETGDAARTYFSADQRVKAPLALLWYGDGPDHGFEKHKDYGRGVKPQVTRGRLFAFNDRGKYLSAIDIYTGRLLWTHKTETSAVRFASMPEAVYVGSGLNCDVLDPATGQVTASLKCDIEVEADKQPGTVAVSATNDLLVLGIGFNLPPGHSHPAIETGLWDARVLVAFDTRTGKQLWARPAEQRFNLHSIAIGKDAVYCVDSIAPLEADNLVRRGTAPDKFPSAALALELKSGKVLWKKTVDYGHRVMTGRGPLAIRPYDDWIAYNAEHDLVLCGKLSEIHALSAANGDDVWKSESAGRQPLILSAESYINQAGYRFDATNGKQLTLSPLFQRTGGCNYTVGNKNLLFLRNKCAAYIDLEEQKEHSLRNLRSGCSNSLVAAGGLLNVPCFSTGCICNYPLQTSFSMYHMPESETWSGITPIALPKAD